MAKKTLFLEAFSRGVELTTLGSTLYVELYMAYSIVLEHVELYTVILQRGFDNFNFLIFLIVFHWLD